MNFQIANMTTDSSDVHIHPSEPDHGFAGMEFLRWESSGPSYRGRMLLSTEQDSSVMLPVLLRAVEAPFREFKDRWKRETQYSSSVSEIVTHFAYLRIVGMGPVVIPLILKELENNPDHWFVALQSLTGENPVEAEHRGNLRQMAEDWLEWARRHGLTW